MARNLLKAGHAVTVWNRTGSKGDALVGEGAERGGSPAAVVGACDVTFAMLSDPAACRATVFGAEGVLAGLESAGGKGKGYVDMSTVDAETSTAISTAVTAAGGRFLEAPVSGSKGPAIDGSLVIMAAGDEGLNTEVSALLDVMGKKTFYLGADVGAGARMKLVVNMVMGTMMGAFAEGMALAEKSDLSQQMLLDILDLGAMSNPMFRLKGKAVLNQSFPVNFPLKHQQKDLRLALALGDEKDQPMPISAAANESYKRAKLNNHGDEDFSAVYADIKK